MKTLQLLSTTIIATALATGAYALPTGSSINSGSAVITTDAASKTLNVTQGTSRVDINWKTFSSDVGETINFNQKSTDIAINRVTGGQASVLNGLLKASGKVVLINDAGITIGKTGQINVQALSAYAGAKNAVIDNEGLIRAKDGYVNLYANNITNNGTIDTTYDGPYSPTGTPLAGAITLVGNNITNNGNLYSQSVTVTNADSATFDSNGLFNSMGNTGTATQTDNLGGTVRADQFTVNSAKTAANAALARNTINLTGVMDVNNLAASGKDINYLSTGTVGRNGAFLQATNDVTFDQKSVASTSNVLNVTAGHNVNLNGKISAKDLSVSAGNDVNINGSLITDSTSSVFARQDITATHLINASSSSNINSGLGEATLTSKGDMNLNGSITTHNLTANATGNLNIGSSSTPKIVADYAYLSAGKDLNLYAGSLTSNYDVFQARDYKTVNLSAGHNLLINKDASVTTAVSGGVSLTSQGSLSVVGNISAYDGVDLTAATTLDISGKVTSSSLAKQASHLSANKITGSNRVTNSKGVTTTITGATTSGAGVASTTGSSISFLDSLMALIK